ncbi:TPM domain-containing protein [Amnibacterium kyonggiense]
MRLHRVLLGLVTGALLTFGGASAAWADGPVDLGAQQLVDSAGVLSSGQETQVRNAIQSYDDATGSDLRVVLVTAFTDPSDRQGWAVDTARTSDSSSDVVVLAVATQQRQYGIARSSDFPLDESTTSSIAGSAVKGPFGSGDWAGGVQAFATALQKAQSTGSGGAVGGTAQGAGSTGGSGVLTFLLFIALIVVIVVVVVVIRRRARRPAAVGGSAATAPVGPPPVDQKELDRRSSRALIALDDELTTSEQELGFATAEFGDRAAQPFAQALAAARQHAQEAFKIRQQLDDDVPETPQQQREMTERIIALCTEADRTLQAQKSAFDDLRKLEQQLPSAVPNASQEQQRLTARAGDAAKALDVIRSRFGEDAVHGAADDLQQAQDLLVLAGHALGDAGTAGSTSVGGGAVALRSAQQALAQAGVLLDGIVAAPTEFMAVKRRLDAAVDDTRNDVAEAERAGSRDRELVAAVAAARAAIETADLQAPPAGLATVEQANGRLERAMAPIRDQQQRLSRAVATLPRALDSADQAVRDARRYIENRRGGVGTEARTRLSEAQRELDRANALQQSDPIDALGSAQHALSLAHDAADLAQRDIDDFRGGGGWGGGYGGGGGSGAFGGAVLGGVLGGILAGGGRSGGWGDGGWGGGGWGGGGFGDGGGGSFGGGGDGGGGFGGGGGGSF